MMRRKIREAFRIGKSDEPLSHDDENVMTVQHDELVDAIQNALNDVIIDDGKTVIIQKVVINFNSVMGGGASLRVSN